MNELLDISILAESENGTAEVIFVVVVALFGIIGSVVTNLKKKRQEQAEQERLAELRNEARAENEAGDDEWSVVEEPFTVTPPPVRAEKSQNIAAIRDFVESAQRRLVPDQEVHKPEPVPVPIPVPKHRHLATPRDHNDVHRTVSCDGVSDTVYSQPPATAIHLDATAARQAIIFHEILSPPKALQENCELWD
jgi:hypothetical protein